jgi:hypothetical protein
MGELLNDEGDLAGVGEFVLQFHHVHTRLGDGLDFELVKLRRYGLALICR